MTRCENCHREMRPYRARKEDHPGTIARATNDTCAGCYSKRGGQKVAPAEAEDPACVLVRVDLRPSTYRILARYAKERHVEVGEVISLLADRSVCRPAPTPRKPRAPRVHVEDDADREIRRLNAEDKSDAAIAEFIGLSMVSVWRRRKNLGLPSPRERALAAS